MSDNVQYFLGVEGEQIGPLSEQELLDKIRQGTISDESLIWWEGQSDWEKIAKVGKFKDEFVVTSHTQVPNQGSLSSVLSPPTPPVAATAKPSVSSNPNPPPQTFISFAEKGAELNPVFKPEEAKVATQLILPKRFLVMSGVFIALSFGTWAILKFKPSGNSNPIQEPKIKKRDSGVAQRKKQFTEAEMELLLNPSKSLQTLTQLFASNPKDEIGVESSKVLLTYYTKNKLYDLAGTLLLKLDRPGEAASMFSQDPKLSDQTEKALFQAFQTTKGTESSDYLIQDIELLIRHLKNLQLATERIALFEKTFPGLPHPFTYYSLPLDQKIKSIFNRVSFKLVEQVTLQMKEEFPQITLVNKPTVEVKRNTTGDLRVLARYQGDLLLRTDRLSNIFFIFWWVDGQWILVDTNLTPERQRFAATMRKKYEAMVLTPNKMLELLEREFRAQLPDQSLHEAPKAKPSTEKRLED